MEWYRHRPHKFNEGTDGLELEVIGAYIRFLNAFYARDGIVQNDDTFLAQLWRCNIRRARRLKLALMEAGKLQIEDGFLTNQAAKFELNIVKTKSIFAQLSAKKRWQNNEKRRKGHMLIKNLEIGSGTFEKAVVETPSTTGKVVPISPELQTLMGKKR